MKRLRKTCNFDEDVEFKITKHENDWKFEFSIYKNHVKIIRAKIYGKSEDKLTSLGVSNNEV